MTYLGRGEAAVEHLERGRPVDLVVSDLRMPGRDGNQLLAWLARHRRDVGRVSLSGNASAAYTPLSRQCAHVDLRKPCPADELEAGIRRVLRVRDVLSAPGWAPLARVFSTAPCTALACEAFDAAVGAGEFSCAPCPLRPTLGERVERVEELGDALERTLRAAGVRAAPRSASRAATLQAAVFVETFLGDWTASARIAIAGQLVAALENEADPLDPAGLQAGLLVPVVDQVPDGEPAATQREVLAFLLAGWSLPADVAEAVGALRDPEPARDGGSPLLRPLVGGVLVAEAEHGPLLAADQRALLRRLAEELGWDAGLGRWTEAYRHARAAAGV